MKPALLFLLALLLAASSAKAQGVITFYNNSLPRNGLTLQDFATPHPTDPDNLYIAGGYALVSWRYPDGTIVPTLTGLGAMPMSFTAGLFLANNLNTPLATTGFRTLNGHEIFAAPQDVTILGVPVGQRALLVVRVWITSAGWDMSIPRGESQIFLSEPLGGQIPGQPPQAPATMSGFMGVTAMTIAPLIIDVPEPTFPSLTLFGTLLLFSRRRNLTAPFVPSHGFIRRAKL